MSGNANDESPIKSQSDISVIKPKILGSKTQISEILTIDNPLCDRIFLGIVNSLGFLIPTF